MVLHHFGLLDPVLLSKLEFSLVRDPKAQIVTAFTGMLLVTTCEAWHHHDIRTTIIGQHHHEIRTSHILVVEL